MRREMKVEYPIARFFSIWVGNFPKEDDFDDAIDNYVVPNLALDTPIDKFCEISFEEEPKTISELLHGFSESPLFADAAGNAACEQKIGPANCALVCYNLHLVDAPAAWGELIFIGSFCP